MAVVQELLLAQAGDGQLTVRSLQVTEHIEEPGFMQTLFSAV